MHYEFNISILYSYALKEKYYPFTDGASTAAKLGLEILSV